MDENNLDSLLDELSSMDGELNENIDIDSGVDVDADDMDDISLDELDHLQPAWRPHGNGSWGMPLKAL